MGYSYSRGYPYSHHSAVHSLHKRSAEPEPEAEAEAEPGYLSRYHGYRSYGHRAYGHHYPAVSYSHGYPYSYHSAVHSLHKRSAEPAPEAEAEPGSMDTVHMVTVHMATTTQLALTHTVTDITRGPLMPSQDMDTMQDHTSMYPVDTHPTTATDSTDTAMDFIGLTTVTATTKNQMPYFMCVYVPSNTTMLILK